MLGCACIFRAILSLNYRSLLPPNSDRSVTTYLRDRSVQFRRPRQWPPTLDSHSPGPLIFLRSSSKRSSRCRNILSRLAAQTPRKKLPHTTYHSHACERWINGNVQRTTTSQPIADISLPLARHSAQFAVIRIIHE